MTDVSTLLNSLRRPRLLVSAARSGLPHYRRATHLVRLLGLPALPGPRQAAMRLICLEQDLEEARRNGAAAYSPAAHVEVLIALMGEARALRDAVQENASATSSFLRAV